jgi:NAD(P)-dependent dehydrogenase (short-subunit alcohol dehydrogenase family)
MKRPPVRIKNALVTGCSSGIGLATAVALKDRGWKVVATARKPADLDRLRQMGLQAVEMEVADSESVRRGFQEALDRLDGVLGGLVNNAGFGQAGAVEDLTRRTLRDQFEVNLFGAMELATLAIAVMRRQGWGRIVNVSSVFGRVSAPYYGSYCASKYAMEAMSDAMRVELWYTGIGVSLIEPGPIVSAFRKTAARRARQSLDLEGSRHGPFYGREIERRMRRGQKADIFTKPPEAVARKIVHALESASPKRRYAVTIPAHLGAVMSRFALPAMLDWLTRRRLPAEAREGIERLRDRGDSGRA